MNFLKEKVRKYQEKKLKEANQKLNSHTQFKNQLVKQLKSSHSDELPAIKDEIEKQENFIKIWKKNAKEIEKQLKKLNS